jgi:hypothetical protein
MDSACEFGLDLDELALQTRSGFVDRGLAEPQADARVAVELVEEAAGGAHGDDAASGTSGWLTLERRVQEVWPPMRPSRMIPTVGQPTSGASRSLLTSRNR